MPSEESIQRSIASYLDVALPAGCWYTAINPIPGKTKIAAARSKAMGMKAGVPDLLIIWHGKPIFIEVKKEGGYLSKVQKEIHDHIRAAGAEVYTGRSIDDVIETLQEQEYEK